MRGKRIKRRRTTDDTAGVDGNAETKEEVEEEEEEEEGDEARGCQGRVAASEALSPSCSSSPGRGYDWAARVPPRRLWRWRGVWRRRRSASRGWVHALTGGGERSLALARCWRGACDRVEDEMISIVHSQ